MLPVEKLSLPEKIGQLIIVRTTGYIFDHQIRYPAWEATQPQLKKWIEELNLGGVILLGGSCAEIAYRTQQLQTWAKTPLFIAADIEEGVGQRFSGASWFPPPMALAEIYNENPSLAIKYAEKMGEITALEALAIGINWILAPVTDINNNPDNPVINVRAFGDKLKTVEDLTSAFVRGCHNYPILTSAKHFPGHGDTATDSHLDLPIINHSLERLQSLELSAFEKVIKEKVDSVMTAHLLVNDLDSDNPATLSPKVLTDLLRKKMSFEGLIITDALIMGGVKKYASPEEIAVKALQAGADILLMPENPEIAIKSVIKAIDSGILSESRIDESYSRVTYAKQKLFGESVNSQSHSMSDIYSLEASQAVNEILAQSMSKGGNIPIQNASEGINLIVVEDLLNCEYLDRSSPAITIPQTRGYHRQVFDEYNLFSVQNTRQPLLLQVFLRGNPFRGRAGLTPESQKFYLKLFTENNLQGVVIYGSPYVKNWFLSHMPKSIPWVFSYGQMPIAQELALKSLFNLSGKFDIVKGDFL
ncbi:glycoside hydrolase family 3 protein [Cyanobacterium aponinum]|uniref:beta-N-acetylhexosaminidase n=1 Tax=Cyanobacterium aponinum 0216 TaxID=2676140 RepID=A0A844GPW9_9CHRO|nr:glycoside hydrolase family 3 N-terminal domain-containing protein [Cyanobacterium aponinum]MTF38604.1 beta-glucosidase [Cyanobacterium aponinum 0216]